MSLVLEIKDLQFRWPGQSKNLLSIDKFGIEKGEKVFLHGPSGSGKSTLLNLIGGVITPQSGKITVMGVNLSSETPAKRDRFRGDHLGFIFQMFNLLPYFSTIENVTLPCKFSDLKSKKTLSVADSLEEEALRLLNELGLGPEVLKQRNVTELSVGQQQRVAVARALMGQPELIIADEPTSALDADARESFLRLLFDECRKSEISLIFVSHDQDLGKCFDQNVSLRGIL